MRSLLSIVLTVCAATFLAPAEAGVFADVGPFQSAAKVRKRIDATTQQTLDRLFSQAPESRGLYDKSVAYAAFDVTKVSLNGLAVYTLTTAGLMLQADLSGTKYWKSKKLNPSQ